LKPLKSLNAEFSIEGDGRKHYVLINEKKREIYVYPAMWSKANAQIPLGAISVSDKLLKYALPKVDYLIRNGI
jgi:hypothetical protein